MGDVLFQIALMFCFWFAIMLLCMVFAGSAVALHVEKGVETLDPERRARIRSGFVVFNSWLTALFLSLLWFSGWLEPPGMTGAALANGAVFWLFGFNKGGMSVFGWIAWLWIIAGLAIVPLF